MTPNERLVFDTGDPDLLALHPFRGILIVSPDAFLTTGAHTVPEEPEDDTPLTHEL